MFQNCVAWLTFFHVGSKCGRNILPRKAVAGGRWWYHHFKKIELQVFIEKKFPKTGPEKTKKRRILRKNACFSEK